MSAELNFFDTYILMAIVEEIVPRQTFFRIATSRRAMMISSLPTRC